jgi:hypothetical protein
MKGLHLLAVSAAMSALLIFAATGAAAQSRPVGGGPRHLPPPSVNGPILGFPGVFVVEREVVHIIEREVVRDVPPAAPAAPAPEPRKPYAIGSSYASLPGGCMKLIADGASYYHCSGEWYQRVTGGSGVQYVAVVGP